MRLSNHESNNIAFYRTKRLFWQLFDLILRTWNSSCDKTETLSLFSLQFILAWCLECDTSQHGITTLLCFDILRIQRVISMTKLKTRYQNHIYMFTCSSNPAILNQLLIDQWALDWSPQGSPFLPRIDHTRSNFHVSVYTPFL